MNKPAFAITSRILAHLLAAAIGVAGAMAWQSGHAQAPVQASLTQTSTEHGVTVVVTPQAFAQGAAEWEFAIKLDTHSGTLDDDFIKTAVLSLDGRNVASTGWSGAAPGGHHREGVLKFPAPAQPPKAIELRVQRDQEPSPRVFRWDGAAFR